MADARVIPIGSDRPRRTSNAAAAVAAGASRASGERARRRQASPLIDQSATPVPDPLPPTGTGVAVNVTLPDSKRKLSFVNTNALVGHSDWKIGLSKTGYINEAGKCLVMQAMIANQPIVIVLLDSWGRLTRIADANRIRKWLEKNPGKLPGVALNPG